MSITLEDIAKVAHVSVSTVSRALSNSEHPINPETRERILKIAQEMGYKPNLLARGLRKEKSYSIGVVVDNIASVFAPTIIRGIQDALKVAGYTCVIVNSDWDIELERSSTAELISRSVDGLIFVDTWLHSGDPSLEDLKVPSVFINRLFSRGNCICPDDHYGARLATEHLIKLGHTRIAFINGPQGWVASENRLFGYQETLESHSISVEPLLVLEGDWNAPSGYQAAMQLFQLDERPTAIFAANDIMALGAIYASREAGLRVPDDVAIVGYDDQDVARLADPTLTTVCMPCHEMGKRAVESLLQQLDQAAAKTAGLTYVRGELIVRESCGDPQGKHVAWSSAREQYFSRTVPQSIIGRVLREHPGSPEPQQYWTPLSLRHVHLQDAFWSERQERVRSVTLPAIYRNFEKLGYLDALKLEWKPDEPNQPHIFWESDLGKWIEAASYVLAVHPDAELTRQVDYVIDLLAHAQQPDGYLNVHFTVVNPDKRWTNLRDWHELYCAGHLIEAAVAHYQATGSHRLLDVMIRYADYIDSVFGPKEGQLRGYPGHEEIELALVKLYRATGEQRYLRLSQFFVEERGRQPHYYDREARLRNEDPADFWAKTYEYNQSHKPVREQTDAVGHAVRAMYLYAAMTDLARETHDQSLADAAKTLFSSVVERQMYVTGSIGSGRHNEGFTADYDLPNHTAYAETCAAIGLFLWMHRLAHLERDAKYVDVMERALFNGILSGLSQKGDRFFYENPLAVDRRNEQFRRKPHHRQPWYGTACCPPNIARLLASLGGYFYSVGPNEAVVQLYAASEAALTIADQDVVLKQVTNYPWDGLVTLTVRPEHPARFAILLRLPRWCSRFSLTINGQRWFPKPERGYLRIERLWRASDEIMLDLDMPVERVYSHPRVTANRGRVALMRGPIVYCLEEVDNRGSPDLLALPRAAQLTAVYEPDLLGGVATILAGGKRVIEASAQNYSTAPSDLQSAPIKAIPYFAWDNRDSGDMLVWMHDLPD